MVQPVLPHLQIITPDRVVLTRRLQELKLDIEEVIERRDNLCIDDLAIAINRLLVHRMTTCIRLETEHFEHAFLGALDIVGDDADLNDVSQFVGKSKILNFHDAFLLQLLETLLGA